MKRRCTSPQAFPPSTAAAPPVNGRELSGANHDPNDTPIPRPIALPGLGAVATAGCLRTVFFWAEAESRLRR